MEDVDGASDGGKETVGGGTEVEALDRMSHCERLLVGIEDDSYFGFPLVGFY